MFYCSGFSRAGGKKACSDEAELEVRSQLGGSVSLSVCNRWLGPQVTMLALCTRLICSFLLFLFPPWPPNATACSVVELDQHAFARASVSPTAEMLREATTPPTPPRTGVI